MTKTLGSSDKYGDAMNYSTEDAKYLDQIMLHEAQHKSIHAHVSLQSMTYPNEGFNLPSVTGAVVRDRDNIIPGCSINPILAAMFIPKFKIFDDHMLLGSIARIVKHRKNRKPINTLQDYQLFYDLISDPTDMACSSQSAMQDLLLRTQLQGSVWKSVTMLRYGKYFDCSSNDFDVAIDNCKLNNYDDTPDFLSIGDEASIVRRLLSAFSLRPTIVQTTVSPTFNFAYPLRPEARGLDIRVEATPMLTYRLGAMQATTTTATAPPPPPSINEVINSQQFVFDRELRAVVPMQVEVIYSKSVLIVNIPRRTYKIDYRNLINPSAEWNRVPRMYAGIDQINTVSITIPEDIDLPNSAQFRLNSAIVLDKEDFGQGPDNQFVIGYYAWLRVETNSNTQANITTPASTITPKYLKYNPNAMFRQPNINLNGEGSLSANPVTIVRGSDSLIADVLSKLATIIFYKSDDQTGIPDANLGLVNQYY